MRSRIPLVLAVALAAFLPAPPTEASIDRFIDDDASRFESFIQTAAEHGIVTGCNPPTNDRFCPSHEITRGELAVMLARALKTGIAADDHFGDDQGHPAESAANALAERGITVGCSATGFCPDRPLRRGEMATMLTRAFGLRGGSRGQFSDLEGSDHAASITRLAAVGGLIACDAPINSRLCPQGAVQRDEAAFALVRAMGLAPALDIPDAPEMQRLEFGDDFEQLELWDGRSPGSRNRVSITGDGYHGSALRVSIPKGSHFGADFKLELADQPDRIQEHLFFRYYLKLDEDWSTRVSGKLPGFSGVYGSSGKGGYQSSPDDPGWSARLMFSPADEDNLVPLGYYVYHLGQSREYGDGMSWNRAGRLHPGDWYCLEGEIEINSPGLSDGTLRAWVDGTPAFDMTGLEFRRPDEPQIRIESFWFDVYYGGKPTAPRDLGLMVDEVVVDTNRIGCGQKAVQDPAVGDVDGDGYDDAIWWDACSTGTCFWQETRAATGADQKQQNGDGAWFSSQTDRFGLTAGDFDGDGRDDLAYRGRCDTGQHCWRVHLMSGGTLGEGGNWGDGARYTSTTRRLVVGDFDGDGRDDLTYPGICGDDARACWRTHMSTGSGFADPADWGKPAEKMGRVLVGDLNGDDRDDLVYESSCNEETCWYSTVATAGAFGEARNLGPVLENDRIFRLIDFNGDQRDDIVSWGGETQPHTVSVRFLDHNDRLTDATSVGVFAGPVIELYLRKVTPAAPVQAIAHVACGERKTCVEYRVEVAGRVLMSPKRPKGLWGTLPQIV